MASLAAYPDIHDDLWKWGLGVLRQEAAAREWGSVPVAIAGRIVQCGRSRVGTRMLTADIWALWKAAFKELDVNWHELYLAEFPQVSEPRAQPGHCAMDGVLSSVHPRLLRGIAGFRASRAAPAADCCISTRYSQTRQPSRAFPGRPSRVGR